MWETPPWGLALAGSLSEICRQVRFDVLHAHFAIPYGAATELATHILGRAAPPWVLTLHGSDVETLSANIAYQALLRHVLERAHGISVPSEHLRRHLTQLGLISAKDFAVIPNFVDVDRFCPDPSLPSPSTGAVLVHVSSFRQVKRIDDVVTIFANVAKRIPARLLLLGDGPQRAAALERLEELGLADRISAPGAQVDVERWLKQAHLALLPSEREGFGLAALEALASGIPVVGSHVGGLPEVVVQHQTGHLAAVGDTDEMSSAALRLLSNDAAWSRARDAARRRALTFSPDSSFDAYETMYHAVLTQRQQR
jgi:N-acetyl-alpha-D-glucosaminyl L-malate synthase BshA